VVITKQNDVTIDVKWQHDEKFIGSYEVMYGNTPGDYPWKEKTERRQEMVTVAPLDVPSEVADKALQVAGKLPDVVAFTEGIKKAGKAFGVRVEYTDPLNQAAPVRVRIYEKKGAGEKLFDAIDVDVKKMSVVKRRRGNMGKENAK
jgi:hypothetical protein